MRAFHNICRHRGNKLVWNDFPQEETSGTCRQFTCKYHGWRYGLEGDLTFVQQEERVLRPRQGRLRPRRRAGRGVGGVHLREPRPRLTPSPLADYLGELGAGLGGLPVRRDDPGLQVPGRHREQLEALHRRLRRVLPRTCPAREAGHGRGVAEAPGLRLRGARLRARRSRTAWCRRGAACRRRPTRAWSSPSRTCCAAGCSDRGTSPTSTSTSCRRPSTRPATRSGAWTRSCSSPTSCCSCGSRAGTSPTTTGRRPTTRHIFEGTLYFVPPKTARERLAQELAAVTFKEYALQDGNTLEATQTMHRVPGRHQLPAERPGDPAAPAAHHRPRPRRRVTRPARSETPVRISAAS